MTETRDELVRTALRWLIQDIDYLQEATGLFENEQIRAKARFRSLFSREASQLHTTAYGIQKDRNSYAESLLTEAKEFEPKVLEEIKKYHTRLKRMSIEELTSEIEALKQANVDKEEAQRPFNLEENSLKNTWFWTRKSLWEPWEAILLLGEREPSLELIEYLNDMPDYEVDESPFATACFQVFELMKSAIGSREISSPGKPMEYLAWFDKMKWDVPEELRSGILEIHATNPDFSPERNKSQEQLESKLTGAETVSLLRLVAGMAIRGYSFDPLATRNQATSDIQSDLDHLGIGLDQKTILKWLREACKTLPTNDD